MPKFVEDASVALGDENGPFMGGVIARGFFARMLYPGSYPVRGDRSVYRRVKHGKRWSPTIRVATFYPLAGTAVPDVWPARVFWFSGLLRMDAARVDRALVSCDADEAALRRRTDSASTSRQHRSEA